ncbi:hypothetical protein [Pseudoalteromonas atlantica]|uniref:hypothetical protein n=1 Tax=Pseudoalteromonas atlantica TaxID=288 RepID=UPI000BBBD964|nr:hypothetical protein [Pseudoalteromonas atlantica]
MSRVTFSLACELCRLFSSTFIGLAIVRGFIKIKEIPTWLAVFKNMQQNNANNKTISSKRLPMIKVLAP